MTDWEIVHNQACKALDSNITWTSLGGQVNYKIRSITPTKIILIRLNGGKDEDINAIGVNRAIAILREKKRMPQGDLMSDVIRQTALTFLHPSVKFDRKTRSVYWENISDNIQSIIEEANDDELEKILIEVNKRKNQSLFRKSIMNKFNGKCVVSQTDINNVLEAAHIIPHSISGINSLSNGILLRSDIHKLFDANLIFINPADLKIVIHESLLDSEYSKFHLMQLNLQTDEAFINNLAIKWDQNNWNN